MSASKKITILLVIIALAGAGIFAYKTFRQSADKKSAAPLSGSAVDQVKQKEFNDAIKKASVSDQDLDGISDTDEAKYQTSVISSDTDEDGLTDWQEIFNFKTNPLKADTDGDGFTDGYEVRRNLNPLVKEK